MPRTGDPLSGVKNDVKSMTGSNIRTILREDPVDPRFMDTHALKNWRVYQQADESTVLLLKILLEAVLTIGKLSMMKKRRLLLMMISTS